jgi:hypothetical protein
VSPLEIVAILALTGWAIYRQTKVSEVSAGFGRFRMAIIYAAAGLVIGGFDTPSGVAGWGMISISLVLSAVVGVFRGRLTHLWVDPDGRVWQRGSALTVGLFVGLIAAKFVLGTLAYLWRIDDGAGFGEVLVMIAVMIAMQAEIVHRRAQTLRRPTAATAPEATTEPTTD